jgi:hypothetical protein
MASVVKRLLAAARRAGMNAAERAASPCSEKEERMDDRCRSEDHLQCGLEGTFPASDPVSAVFTSVAGCPKP